MRLRKFHISLLLLIGFLISPEVSFACDNPNNENYRGTSAKACNERCCKQKKQTSRCGQNHEDCNGKCGHSSCHCPPFPGIGFALVPIDMFNLMFTDSIHETLQFGYTETAFKSAINSLRLPPKIS